MWIVVCWLLVIVVCWLFVGRYSVLFVGRLLFSVSCIYLVFCFWCRLLVVCGSLRLGRCCFMCVVCCLLCVVCCLTFVCGLWLDECVLFVVCVLLCVVCFV